MNIVFSGSLAEQVPNDVLNLIAAKLDVRDFLNLCQTNKKLFKLYENDSLWENFLKRDYLRTQSLKEKKIFCYSDSKIICTHLIYYMSYYRQCICVACDLHFKSKDLTPCGRCDRLYCDYCKEYELGVTGFCEECDIYCCYRCHYIFKDHKIKFCNYCDDEYCCHCGLVKKCRGYKCDVQQCDGCRIHLYGARYCTNCDGFHCEDCADEITMCKECTSYVCKKCVKIIMKQCKKCKNYYCDDCNMIYDGICYNC